MIEELERKKERKNNDLYLSQIMAIFNGSFLYSNLMA
jgi:hypothetical protein